MDNRRGLKWTVFVPTALFVVSTGVFLYYVSTEGNSIDALNKSASDYPVYLDYVFLAAALIMVLSVLVAATGFTVLRLVKRKPGSSKILYLLKIVCTVLLFPLILFVRTFTLARTFKNIKNFGIRSYLSMSGIWKFLKKIIALAIIVLVVLPVWFGLYYVPILISMGNYHVEIPISGESHSMYPTFGKEIIDYSDVSDTPGMRPYKPSIPINRGDIINFEGTGEYKFLIKRVIGIAGDTILLKDGIVYLNSEKLREPYTFKARSTYGEDFLKDCQTVTVPKHSLFAMGDNRMSSGDSREFGFVDTGLVRDIISLSDQKGTLDTHWRDTSADFSDAAIIRMDKTDYLKRLNEIRDKNKLRPLRYDYRLEKSAENMARQIIGQGELSSTTLMKYTLDSIESLGSYNTKYYGYYITDGRWTAQALSEILVSATSTSLLTSDDNVTDIGIAEVDTTIHSCPHEVILQQAASEWKN